MFGLIADGLTTVTSVLFPVFASYKALRTNDPAQTTPWLMYWVITSLFTSAEDSTYFILGYVPFYSWFRLGLHLWLVMPGSQGATALYQEQLHPFLQRHEMEIDEFIGNTHEKLRAAGMDYMNRAIEYIKVNVMGMQPRPPPPPPPRGASYAQSLLSRFSIPAARQGLAAVAGPAAAGDFYGFLSSALQSATSGRGAAGMSREAQVADLNSSGTLIPNHLESREDKLDYISRQREGLRTLLQAFDKEAHYLGGGGVTATAGGEASGAQEKADLTKSRSEVDFERIEYDAAEGAGASAGGKGQAQRSSSQQGGWMPWNWAAKGQTESSAKSSGVDLGQ